MAAVQADVEQVWQTIDALPSEGRKIILSRLTSAKTNEKVSHSPKTLLEDERFLIPFEDYLALSDNERDEIQSGAYEKYGSWIDEKLEQLRAQWMLLCGGKLIEWSAKLQDYPSDEKMHALGKQLGYAPLVFVANLHIEESLWAALPRDDFYPSLTVTIGATDWDQADLSKKGITKVISVICVRNWQHSSLCLVNPARKALVGRNLLYEFPLRVELDGGARITKILAVSE